MFMLMVVEAGKHDSEMVELKLERFQRWTTVVIWKSRWMANPQHLTSRTTGRRNDRAVGQSRSTPGNWLHRST
jgi:hypothetical protein